MLKINLNSSPAESWQQEMKDAFTNVHQLSVYLQTDLPKVNYPLFVTKSLASKIKKSGIDSPLWRQFVPAREENSSEGLYDPIGDHGHQKTNQLIHRYKNRALIMPTKICPVACRYCFRKNELSNSDEELFRPDWAKTFEYLANHTEINEIIFSGGDPLILGNKKLLMLMEELSKMKHIKTIRFHSRVPVILPSRMDKGLENIFKFLVNHFENVIVAVHTNHESEMDRKVEKFTSKLKQLGVMLLGQAVLLRNVNDDLNSLTNLFKKMNSLGIRPYYLHHPDRVKGGMHFYLPLIEGRMLYAHLKDSLSSWLLPHYVIDIPGGEGKVNAFNPEGYDFSGKLINRKGEIVSVAASQNH